MRRIALYSDVHANTVALEVVSAEMAFGGLEERYCLGDLVGLGPHPEEAVALVRAYGDRVIQGNYDRAIGSHLRSPGSDFSTAQEELDGAEAYAFTIAETSRAVADYLYVLPRELRIEENGARIILCHATPRLVSEIVPADTSSAQLTILVRDAHADVVCCGHTHVPIHRSIPTGGGPVHWVNVGSVGRPRDGDPRAAWVELVIGTQAEVVGAASIDVAARRIGESEMWLGVVIHRIAYDTDAVARDMVRRGLPATLAAGIRLGREEHDVVADDAARRSAAAAEPEPDPGDRSQRAGDRLACGHLPEDECGCNMDERIAAYESLARILRGDIAEVSPALQRLRAAMRSCRVNRNVDESAIVDAFERAHIVLRTAAGRDALEAERERLYGLQSGFDPFAHVLSPDEVTYVSGDVREHTAALERAYQGAFFSIPRTSAGTYPPGHITIELGFMAHCLRASAAGDPRAIDRARVFFVEHLAEWAVLFSVVVAQQAREPVMRYAGLSLDKLLACEAALFRRAVPELPDQRSFLPG
ncbi:MAG: hypothetical protein EG823_06705 [Actinobacteria bacterium]|nr:hypothetical protein [Actinomycetota bacterium]